MKYYRQDIDGLRAIAVTSVVLFHATLTPFSGGFVGVDVFFVISGFLIGDIVNREAAEGRFSFTTFYARRARRILPALVAVTLVTLAICLVLLETGELRGYLKSGLFALLGLSNIHFFLSSDYFAAASHFDPFLMTWSLGVEEQFYVFLPPILLLVYRLAPRHVFATVAGLSALSLLGGLLLTTREPQAAFYLLPTRAWEMGAGVLLALWQARRGSPELTRSASLGEVLALAGLALVIGPIVFYDETTPFPGSAAILPVLGTALLLSTPGSRINRSLLSLGPMRMIGMLSYSWYLTHWPLMALTRLVSFSDPSTEVLSLMAVISLGLAYLSWRFVEQPFRRARSWSDGRQLAAYGGALAVLVIGIAGAAYGPLRPGVTPPMPLPQHARNAAPELASCQARYGNAPPDFSETCWPEDARAVLLGDSHAASMGLSLRRALAERGIPLALASKSSCPAFLTATRAVDSQPAHAEQCARFNRRVLDRVLADPQIEQVYITGFWKSVITPGETSRVLLDNPAPAGTPEEDVFAVALTETVEGLQAAGKTVILLGDNPALEYDPLQQARTRGSTLRQWLQQRLSSGQVPDDGRIPLAYVTDDTRARDTLDGLATELNGVIYLPLYGQFCSDSGCQVADAQGRFFHVDGHHLSVTGADFALKDLPLPAAR